MADNVIRAALTNSPVAVLSTGDLSHVGAYRPKLRLYPSTADVMVRLSWQDGDTPLAANEYASPPGGANAWSEIDLGVISVRAVTLGTQRWRGVIEAYADTPGATVDVDYLILVPCGEGYGKARSVATFQTATAFTARDEFDQAAGALTGKTAPTGGVWAGAGDGGGFTVETTGKTAERAVISDADINTGRYAISGAAASGAQVVQVDCKVSTVKNDAGTHLGVLARYTDTSNWLMSTLSPRLESGDNLSQVVVRKRVAGTVTTLATVDVALPAVGVFRRLHLSVDAAGRWILWYFAASGSPDAPVASGVDSALATGGALASGKPGFYDAHTTSQGITRNYDNFQAFTPVVDAVMFSGSDLQVRATDPVALRKNGTLWGRPPQYRGSRFLLSPAGQEGKVSRVLAKANRTDVDEASAENVTDNLIGSVAYRPRFYSIPRS